MKKLAFGLIIMVLLLLVTIFPIAVLADPPTEKTIRSPVYLLSGCTGSFPDFECTDIDGRSGRFVIYEKVFGDICGYGVSIFPISMSLNKLVPGEEYYLYVMSPHSSGSTSTEYHLITFTANENGRYKYTGPYCNALPTLQQDIAAWLDSLYFLGLVPS